MCINPFDLYYPLLLIFLNIADRARSAISGNCPADPKKSNSVHDPIKLGSFRVKTRSLYTQYVPCTTATTTPEPPLPLTV